MAGVLIHLLAGSALAVVGRYYFSKTFSGDNKLKQRLLLIFTCLFLSIVPDVFIGLNIFFGTELMSFHLLLHVIFLPISIFFLLMLHYFVDVEDEPIIVMGMWAIAVHIAFDYAIHETGMLI